jgi:hypothetical protein
MRNRRFRYWPIASALLVALVLPASAYEKHSLPHYEFILPDGYVGWVQVIFRSPGSTALEEQKNKLIVRVNDSGVVKTGNYHAYFTGQHDEFFYERNVAGKVILSPVPTNCVCPNDSGLDGCLPIDGTRMDAFTVSRATVGHEGESRDGNSWFLFIGPSDLRQKFAVPVHLFPGTKKKLDVPKDDPTPGRIKQ